MKGSYHPIFLEIFKKYSYSWEDLDIRSYENILREEGYEKKEILKEIEYLKKKRFGKKNSRARYEENYLFPLALFWLHMGFYVFFENLHASDLSFGLPFYSTSQTGFYIPSLAHQIMKSCRSDIAFLSKLCDGSFSIRFLKVF